MLVIFVSIILQGFPVSHQHDIYVPELPHESYERPGSLMLGVLMSVHHSSKHGQLCGEQVGDMGLLQRMEAVAYAIREVNSDPTLLLNHTLGFVMYDDCFTDMTALAQTLHFARVTPPYSGYKKDPKDRSCNAGNLHHDAQQSLRHVPIIGLLGSESSITTVEAANMMRVFRIPHVSYMASSPSLSNKLRYPAFWRLVPSDAVQAKAIVAMLRHFEWTFVNVLYARGEYGEEAFKALVRETEETENSNICFNKVTEIHPGMTQLDYVSLMLEIVTNQAVNVSVVVVFAPSFQGRDILKAASALPSTKGRITWIASNSWVNHIEELDKNSQMESVGMLSLSFESANVSRFDAHFQNITIGGEPTLNPWIGQFWKTYHNCSVSYPSDPQNVCNDYLSMADHPSYTPDKFTSLVFDGVYTFAYALDVVLKGPCFSIDEDELYPCIHLHLNDVLMATEFTGNDGNPVSFDENGDRLPAKYVIHNVQDMGNDTYELVNIGMYVGENESLIFNGRRIQWTSGSEKPASVCSVKCKEDEGTVYNQKRCCWTCQKCRADEILWRLGDSEDIWFCMKCQDNQWPNKTDKTQCVDIIPEWLSIKDPLGIGMAAIATVGIVCAVLVFLVFVFNDSHVLVKASSRELMFLMLAGLIVCYIFVFVFLIKPTEEVCVLKMIGVSVSFTLIYSPMSIKSIRIYRIFESGKKMNRKLRLVSGRSQLIMATAIVLVHVSLYYLLRFTNDNHGNLSILFIHFLLQGVILALWLCVTSPYVEIVEPSGGYQEIICTFPPAPFTASFVFNGILLVICAFYAFLTRKVPDNFNESRFIAFCVYSTLIIWLSVMPAYITATTSTLRVSLLCSIIILNASVPLLLIFFPKVYAIYCMPPETLNVRRITHSHNNSTCADCVDKVAPDLVSSTSVGGTCHTHLSCTKRADPSVPSALNKVVPLALAVNTVISEKDEVEDEPDTDKWI